MSIHTRLVTGLLSVTVVVNAATITLSYRDAQHEIQELFDAQLGQSARVLLAMILPRIGHHDMREIQAEFDQLPRFVPSENEEYEDTSPFGHAYEQKIAFQLIDKNGKVLLRSATATPYALNPHSVTPDTRGFSDTTIDNNLWRVFSLWDMNEQYLLQVAERYEVRDELVTHVSNRLVLPAILSLPFMALLIWLAIGRGLAPIQSLIKQVTRRDPQNLAPLSNDTSPRELQPLIKVLNDLFVRLSNAFKMERQFTDDAAHELRTPLTAIKTHAQVALRSQDDREKNIALRYVVQGVNRSAHLLEQLLTLARLDNTTQITHELVEVSSVLDTVIEELTEHAREKLIDIHKTRTDQALIEINPYSLSILLRNLLENAINYAPEKSIIEASVTKSPAGVQIQIIDAGPGIPEDMLPRVFDRFYRGDINNQRIQGCGLGLAIVKQIADMCGIGIELKNRADNTGLEATVSLQIVHSDRQV